MVLYLSSQKFGYDINYLKKWIQKHDNRILLIFNALDAKSKDKINTTVNEDIKLLERIGFNVKVSDLKQYFGKYEKLKQDFSKYNAYCVIGGNVFVLRQAMKYSGMDKFLCEISANNNYLYIGYSAGSCVLGKNLKIFEHIDEPIKYYGKDDIVYNGIGLINYVFVPHYKSNYHKVNLIDDAVQKCKKENIEFIAIKDGEVIIKE